MGEYMIFILGGFVSGVLIGASLTRLYIEFQTRKIIRLAARVLKTTENIEKQKKAKFKRKIETKNKFNKKVTLLIEEADKIITTQNHIVSALGQPSKNAVHSKYKNKMNDDWKMLEDMKQEIFMNILKAGADPIINVYDDAIQQTKEMKLSTLIEMMGTGITPSETNDDTKKLEAATEKGTKIKKIIKNGRVFHLIKGGKNDKIDH